MSILRLLLFPFAVLYDGITRLRNRLYDTGNRPSVEFDLPVICVGNLNVGGSGKTPMTEYLVRLLGADRKVAILSRGYGRKTRGFRLAGTEDTASTLGDEPFQYFRKFGSKVTVAVGEQRALAIPEILHHHPDTNVVLLDDAYQHRAVRPQFSILLTEYSRPFFSDYVLPMGTLREARRGARRADVVVVTKCPPAISIGEREDFIRQIRPYASRQQVFFSTISYDEPVPVVSQPWNAALPVVLVSGIAQSSILEASARSSFHVLHHFDFADHHAYTKEDIDRVNSYCSSLNQPVCVLTTEKDMVKLLPFGDNLLQGWFYWPIATVFVENGAEFDTMVRKAIQS